MTYQDLRNKNGNHQTTEQVLPMHESSPMGQDDTIDLQEYISVIMRRKWLILATIAIVFIVGVLYTVTRKPEYQSSAAIVVVTHNSGSSGGDIPLISDLEALTKGRSIDTQKEIISSHDLLDKAYARLSPELRAKGFGSDTIPAWAFDVQTKKDTDVLSVTCTAYSPDAAAKLATAIVDTYFRRDLEYNSQATTLACQYAAGQMKSIEKELRDAGVSLAQYKRKIGVVDAPTQLAKTAEIMAQMQIDVNTSTADLSANSRGMGAIRNQMGSQRAETQQTRTITSSPLFMATQDNINQLEIKRAEALQEYRPDSKEVKKIQGEIDSEQQRLKKIANTMVSSQTLGPNPIHQGLAEKYTEAIVNDTVLKGRLAAVNGILNGLKKEAMGLPEKDRILSQQMQKVELLRNTYAMLSEKYYTLLLTERSALPAGQLISAARPSEVPSYPKKTKSAVLYLLLGVMLAAVAAMTAEKLDVRIHDQASVERMTGLPTLAVVPLINEEGTKLIADADRNSTLLESCRILRSNIAFSAIDKDMKLIAVSGPGRGEGKSTTAANLAIAMAMDGKKVLLVDADMRRPSLHRLFGVSRSIGFTNVVTGKTSLDDAIVATKTENLFVLPSGPIPPNPPEVLNSSHSRELLESLKQKYDMVIMDCPPCAGLSDVQVVSTFVDGLLLVISINQTLKPHLDITMRSLSQLGAPFIGTVLNKMDVSGKGYYYYYYYYSYNYGKDVDGKDQPAPYKRKRRQNKKHSE